MGQPERICTLSYNEIMEIAAFFLRENGGPMSRDYYRLCETFENTFLAAVIS